MWSASDSCARLNGSEAAAPCCQRRLTWENSRRPLLALLCDDGALAQLGERRLCKPEVTGSIPVRSIEEDPAYGAFRSLSSEHNLILASVSASSGGSNIRFSILLGAITPWKREAG